MSVRRTLWLALGLAAALAPALAADVYYVPSPDPGASKGRRVTQQSTLEVVNGDKAAASLALAFVPTGKDGTAVQGRAVSFAGGGASYYDATSLAAGPGLLKLTASAPALAVGQAAFYLWKGGEDSTWALPVISAANQFAAGATAYLEDLRRGPDGASNVEVVNLGGKAASCQIRLVDPAGVALLPALSAAVPAQGHAVSKDVILAAHAEAMLGGEARVTCDEPFYAYATYAPADFRSFRLIQPLAQPPAAAGRTAVLDRPGAFFTATSAASYLDLPLPLVPGVAYRRVTVDFDMTIKKFGPVFDSILGLVHAGGPRFHHTLYYGFNLRGASGRLFGDLGQATLDSVVKRSVGFAQGGTYHVRIVYDTQAKGVLFLAADKTGALVMDALAGSFNWDLRDSGNAPLRLFFGLDGVGDGAYFPPFGYTFANLHAQATP
jgi:hypothetical protein